MQKGPPTPKGFRDIAPEIAIKRRKVINKIAEVLESHGFVPLETPTVEFAQTLTGKYGEEEKLIYKFADRGDRELALRYDLTVPLARFIANNQSLLEKGPFRRYQIGQVFRGENPQHGRYREFTQFDFDTVGLEKNEPEASALEDAKTIITAIKAIRSTGLKNARMAINDAGFFSSIPIDIRRVWDKYYKIGEVGVKEETLALGYSNQDFEKHKTMITLGKKTVFLKRVIGKIIDLDASLKEEVDYYFDPYLARGLDYYTGTIFELKPTNDPKSLSIGAGGRYDNLIGMFAKRDIPAVGFSFGIDRIVELI